MSDEQTDVAAMSVSELVGAALTEPDELPAWYAVWELQSRGTREVFDAAASLCRSECPAERTLGADLLADLGTPEMPFAQESSKILRAMLSIETEGEVIESILPALSRIEGSAAIPEFLGYEGHPSEKVRQRVSICLSGSEDERCVAGLIRLMRDPEPFVRDWATFGLGTMLVADTAAIREALVERLEDSDCITRGEAMRGLAERDDLRVIPAILKELASGNPQSLALEAAETIGSPELHAPLLALKAQTPEDPWLDDAIEACRPA